MANKQNYRVQAELDVKRFKTGANVLRKEFASLKSSFLGFSGALGAGLGFTRIVSQMKDIAVNMSVARATLKNVSHGVSEYNENLAFTQKLSEDYSQDLITVTDSFAKFRAACQLTNFSLAEQREMYDALIQTATFYHLSGDKTRDMLMAIEQILSKNKVTAEELRRQLGNVVPGAVSKMAQAAIDLNYKGIKSFADFENAMKKGEVGVEVLQQFARNLKKETAGFDTKSLVLKLNQLKNAAIRFTENSNFEEWFTNVVDKSIKGLDFLADHIKEVGKALRAAFDIWLLQKFGGFLKTLFSAMKKGATNLFSIKSIFETIYFYILEIGSALGKVGKFFTSIGGGVTAAVTALGTVVLHLNKVTKAANDAIKSYEKLLEVQNNQQQAPKVKYEEAQKAFNEAQAYLKANEENYKKWKEDVKQGSSAWANSNGPMRGGVGGGYSSQQTAKGKASYSQIKIDEYEAMLKKKDLAIKMMTEAAIAMGKGMINIAESATTINGGDEDTETDFEKLIKKYQKEIKELNNQFNAGTITAQKYKEEAQDLAQKTWENVTAFDDFRGEIAKLDPELRKVAGELEKAFVNPYLHDAVTKLSDATKGYYEEVGRLNTLKSAGLIKNQEEYNDALQKAAEKAVEAMAGINGLANVIALLDPLTQQLIGNIISTYKKGLSNTGNSSKLSDLQAAYQEAITRPKVNHRFDYEKTQEEIIRAEAEAAAEWAENIKKFKEKYADELSQLSKEQLDNIEALGREAAESATNLTDLADVTKWLEDVKNLRKELGKGIYGSVKDTAEAMDRLTSGAKSFKKTMEDTDSTVWDKILESINLLIQSIDTVISLVESYNTVSEISRNLSRAKHSEEMRALGTKLAGETGLIAAKNTELTVDKLAEAQAKKNATASLAETSAKSGEAVAGATASGAKMPFPYNLIAIAAGVSAVLAALSSISRFAGGGIVSGSKHGDRNLAAVNGGEMILNQNQQDRLWGWLNGRGNTNNGSNNKVEFVISGSNLRGVLKNEERIRTQHG